MSGKSMNSSKLFDETKKINNIFIGVLCVQVIMSIGIGLVTDTLMLGFLSSIFIIALPIFMSFQYSSSLATKLSMAIAIQLMASLHIQQTMGMTEMHFQVFVLLAFLSFYRDWKVIVAATGVIAVHHVLGFVSQHSGGGIVVFESAQPAFMILLIHASFAVVECAVLSIMAHKSAKEYKIAIQVNHSIEKIMATDGMIDLRPDNLPSDPDLKSVGNMLIAVRNLAEQTNEVGEGLLKIADKVKHSSMHLDSTVNEQNTQVASITEFMSRITNSINEVSGLSQSANAVADGAKDSTKQTRTAIEGSKTNITDLKHRLESTSNAISDLSAKCENISSVMQSIKSVAEQTNLLALNAAIESARAGEHGRGFAVVADEVRNLAIKSKESAEEIEKITSLLTESANNSVVNMNTCVEMVDLAVESSQSATDNMSVVFTSIEQVTANVINMAKSATDQASVTMSITDSTNNLNNLFSSEKDQVEDLHRDVLELNKLADALDAQLKMFKLA